MGGACRGRAEPGDRARRPAPDLTSGRRRTRSPWTSRDFYERTAAAGYEYGSFSVAVRRVWRGSGRGVRGGGVAGGGGDGGWFAVHPRVVGRGVARVGVVGSGGGGGGCRAVAVLVGWGAVAVLGRSGCGCVCGRWARTRWRCWRPMPRAGVVASVESLTLRAVTPEQLGARPGWGPGPVFRLEWREPAEVTP